jgi:hypothetical protein
MFGRNKDLAAKLREQGGVEAPATITDAAILWTSQGHTNSADVDAAGDTKHCEVTVKVEPDGQPPFEQKFKQTFPDHIPHPGQQAKVIYDLDKHSKIAIVDGTMSWGGGPPKSIRVGPDQLASLFDGAVIQKKTD